MIVIRNGGNFHRELETYCCRTLTPSRWAETPDTPGTPRTAI